MNERVVLIGLFYGGTKPKKSAGMSVRAGKNVWPGNIMSTLKFAELL